MRRSSISTLLVVDDVDDVQGLAVLTVGADVVEDLANRPVIPDRHVGRRHQASNRFLGVTKQRERDRALLRCQERKELTGRGRR